MPAASPLNGVPLVYCLESADQPAIRSLFDVELAGPAEPFSEEFDAELLGGVLVSATKVEWRKSPLRMSRFISRLLGRSLRCSSRFTFP
jgi:hypothetical protein